VTIVVPSLTPNSLMCVNQTLQANFGTFDFIPNKTKSSKEVKYSEHHFNVDCQEIRPFMTREGIIG
jgi:hypothetical protein